MTQMTLKITSFLLLIFLSSACSLAPKPGSAPTATCQDTRGSVDMGSGTTKAMVALVDFCEKKILKVLLSEQTPIGFKDALANSKDNRFDSETLEEAHVKYTALISSMKKLGAHKIKAVATAAFRSAANGQEAAKQIAATAGVPIRIISQAEEAELGVNSALILTQNSENKEKPIAVWDIGGGSMQMSYFKDQKLVVFEGDLASVSFKNAVIRNIQKKNPESVSSPNPLNTQRKKAVKLAEKHATEKTSAELKIQSPLSRWVGIGGVWWHSLRKQVPENDSVITAKELETALKKRSALRDSEIGGSYSTTDVTNIALVLGYMKVLRIKEVQPVDASLNQALLF